MTTLPTNSTNTGPHTQAEAPRGLKCGSFGASSLEDRQLATGDHGGTLSLWLVEGAERDRKACVLVAAMADWLAHGINPDRNRIGLTGTWSAWRRGRCCRWRGRTGALSTPWTAWADSRVSKGQ